MTAALGSTIDLMDLTRKGPLIVQQGESLNVTGQLVDFAGDPILKAGLSTLLMTLFDEATSTIINDVDQDDRLSEVASDGSFTLKLDGPDNIIVNTAGVGSGQIEKHVLALYWRWNDGTQDRSGIQLIRFRVQRLGVQVFPAVP